MKMTMTTAMLLSAMSFGSAVYAEEEPDAQAQTPQEGLVSAVDELQAQVKSDRAELTALIQQQQELILKLTERLEAQAREIERIKSGEIIVKRAERATMLRGRNEDHWMRYLHHNEGNRDYFALWSTDDKWHDLISVAHGHHANHAHRAEGAVMLRARDDSHWMKFREVGYGNRDIFSLWRTTDKTWHHPLNDRMKLLRGQVDGTVQARRQIDFAGAFTDVPFIYFPPSAGPANLVVTREGMTIFPRGSSGPRVLEWTAIGQ